MSSINLNGVFTPNGEVVVLAGNKKAELGSVTLSNRQEITDNEKLAKVLKAVCKNRIIVELSLCNLPISGSSLFGKWDKSYVRVLNLSGTEISATIFKMLKYFPDLQELICNDCPRLYLENLARHEKVQEISILGSQVLPGTIRNMLRELPQLQKLNCTINLNDQVPIGLMHRHGLIHPVVTVPYGYISAGEAKTKDFISLHQLSVRLQKVDKCWKVFLLDVNRRPIKGDGRVFMHKECREFFPARVDVCPSCTTRTPPESYQEVELQLDSSLDLDNDFDLLMPSCPYDLIRRSQFYAK